MARSILDASEEEINSVAKALEQLQKNADRLTNSQKKLLAEFGRMSKTSTGLKEELSLLETYERLFKVRKDGQKDFNDLLKIQNDLRSVELQLAQAELREAEKDYQLQKDMSSKRKDDYQERLKEAKKWEKELKKLVDEQDKLAAMPGGAAAHNLADEIKAHKEIVKEEKKKAAAAKEALKTQRKIETTARNKANEDAHAAVGQEKQDKALGNIESGTKSLIKTFTGVTDQSDTFVGSLIQSHKLTGDWSAATTKIKNVYKGTFNSLNVGLSLLTKVFESTVAFMLEFDKLASSFRKNTGIIDRGFGGIEQSIVNVQRSTLRMGVSMDEAFAAANALTSGMAEFTSMSDNARDKVLQVTALMQEFGVSAQTTSEIFNTFSKGLGYNAKELEKLGTQIMGIATSLKVPPQIIATEFNAASRELMKYGGDMIKVFEGLAEQSKQTGIAVGELMGIVKQYDTFEGAGAAVGKLNAILGGPYLNSINMLYATEEERVKMMRESIQMSGRQFKDLSRFEQQAIASAAGISDMSQAAKLFGGTSSEFSKSQMSMKEMEEQAAKAQAAMDKFKMVMQSFAIALGPLITALGFVATAALYMLNPFGEIARIFGADSDVISGIGTFTIVGYGAAAMINKGWIPALSRLNMGFISLKMTTFQILAVFTAAIAAFALMYNWTKSMTPELGMFATVMGALAIGMAAFWIASTVGLAAPAIIAGTIGAAAAIGGAMGVMSNYEEGKKPGQQVPGGRGLVAENGEEMVMTADGSTYMVTEPSVVALGTQDTVFNNAETKAAMAGGGNLLPILTSLQSTLATLTNAISAANQPTSGEKDDKPVVIKMDERKVAETTVEFIRRHKLRLG